MVTLDFLKKMKIDAKLSNQTCQCKKQTRTYVDKKKKKKTRVTS